MTIINEIPIAMRIIEKRNENKNVSLYNNLLTVNSGINSIRMITPITIKTAPTIKNIPYINFSIFNSLEIIITYSYFMIINR